MKLLGAALALFLLSTAYIAAVDQATVFYVGNVLGHYFGGLLLAAIGVVWLIRKKQWIPAALFTAAIVPAIYLAHWGNTLDKRAFLYAHIALCLAGLIAMGGRVRMAAIGLTAAVLAIRAVPEKRELANNVHAVPASMEQEGNRQGPFWPSPANTNVGKTIPSDFFMDSKLCGSCHKDIYEQWNSSMHHFSSFNNQFYRKAIEEMQRIQGSTQPSKWCAGCHDHAVFFNGRWEKPIKDQIQTPEAQNGLGCVSCHSISHVNGSVGNGGFVIEYPPLHKLAASKDPMIRKIDEFFTFLDPGPHRKTFMKPFMKQNSEYCSTCHKVHLDVPVNSYRWLRGFNDYDNWQASAVSGQGARSFYYPATSSTCSDCHMSKVRSKDPGNVDGWIHNHRFATANTAVAHVNKDKAQLDAATDFLKSGFMSIDIFAVSPVEKLPGALEMRRRGGDSAPALSSTMAVGEEGESQAPVYVREVGEVAAPLDTAQVKLEPGSEVRMDVVVRTRKIGHFFPGGTVDAFDVWVELQGKDAKGRVIFWSGMVEDEGKGAVERGAHFYRSYMLDGQGDMINKRNAWQARSVLYVRLIPPGAADTIHYRVKVPKDVEGPITFTAKLNHRKFSHFYAQYAYDGVGTPPVQPITTIAEKAVTFGLGKTEWKQVVKQTDRERWNDWGIGMLLQGDLKGAEYAFRKVTEAEPGYADGWLNVARALIQEGETEAAKPLIAKALEVNSKLGRIHFFKAMIEKADGDYAAAAASLNTVLAQYPRDRVALNQLGRVRFLQRDYAAAVEALQRVLAVDTEDLQAHYNLMLAYRGLGETEKAAHEEQLFRRFKADESAQAVTAKPRLLSAEDNNERQAIHDHESVPLFVRDAERANRSRPAGRQISARPARPVQGRDADGGN